MGAGHISDRTASDSVLQRVQTKVQRDGGEKCSDKSLKRQTELTMWVHILVKLCGHISNKSTAAAGGLSYCSSRNCENLETYA